MFTYDFDAWMYRGETAKLFRAGEQVPEGWYDRPSRFNGADPAAFDHDGVDGPGGSMPKKRGRPPKARASPDVAPRDTEGTKPSGFP